MRNRFHRCRVAQDERRRSSSRPGAASPTGLHLRNPHISSAELSCGERGATGSVPRSSANLSVTIDPRDRERGLSASSNVG